MRVPLSQRGYELHRARKCPFDEINSCVGMDFGAWRPCPDGHVSPFSHPSNTEYTTQNNENNFLIGSEVNRLYRKTYRQTPGIIGIRAHTHTHSCSRSSRSCREYSKINNYYLRVNVGDDGDGNFCRHITGVRSHERAISKTRPHKFTPSRRITLTIKRIAREHISSPPSTRNSPKNFWCWPQLQRMRIEFGNCICWPFRCSSGSLPNVCVVCSSSF